jgi:hypothetical protein
MKNNNIKRWKKENKREKNEGEEVTSGHECKPLHCHHYQPPSFSPNLGSLKLIRNLRGFGVGPL